MDEMVLIGPPGRVDDAEAADDAEWDEVVEVADEDRRFGGKGGTGGYMVESNSG